MRNWLKIEFCPHNSFIFSDARKTYVSRGTTLEVNAFTRYLLREDLAVEEKFPPYKQRQIHRKINPSARHSKS